MAKYHLLVKICDTKNLSVYALLIVMGMKWHVVSYVNE